MAKAVISFPGSFFKYAFQSKSTLCSCLNVKEHLARNRSDIWSLSDNNGIQTHNHLVCKRTLNHYTKLASLAKWSSVHLQTKWLWVRILLLSLRLHEFTWRFFKTITSIDIKKRTIAILPCYYQRHIFKSLYISLDFFHVRYACLFVLYVLAKQLPELFYEKSCS